MQQRLRCAHSRAGRASVVPAPHHVFGCGRDGMQGWRMPATAAAQPDATAATDKVMAERRDSGASASTSGSPASGGYRLYGSRLRIREGQRQPGWWYLDDESYLPRALSQVIPPHLRTEPADDAEAPASSSSAATTSSSNPTPPSPDQQQQQQRSFQHPHRQRQQQQRLITASDVNRMFTKALSSLGSPEDLWALLHTATPHYHQQRFQPQQQQPPAAASGPGTSHTSSHSAATSSDPSTSTSSSSSNGQQPLDLSFLDGRSIVAALVWCVKYLDGHITGPVTHAPWYLQQVTTHPPSDPELQPAPHTAGDKRSDSPTQQSTSDSSSTHVLEESDATGSTGVRPESPAAPSGVRPRQRLTPPRTQQRLIQAAATALSAAAAALASSQQQQGAVLAPAASAAAAWGLPAAGATAGGAAGATPASASAAATVVLGQLFSPPDLCSLVYCCAKLQQVQQRELVASAAAALEGSMFACSPDELFRLSWGLAALGLPPSPTWVSAFTTVSQAKFPLSEPRHLAIYAYALARLGVTPPTPWVTALLAAAQPWMQQQAAGAGAGFNGQNMANLMWALGKWRVQLRPDWVADFVSASHPLLSQLPPVALSQVAAGLALCGAVPPQHWAGALEAAAGGSLASWEPVQLCNLLKACAKWDYRPSPEVLQSWCEASAAMLPTATPEDLTMLLWAFSLLGYLPPETWWAAWLDAAAAALPRLQPQQLQGVARAWGRWGVLPAAPFMRLYLQACRARFGAFTAGELSSLVTGLAESRALVSPRWLQALLGSFCQLLPTAKPWHILLVFTCAPRLYRQYKEADVLLGREPQVGPLLQQLLVALQPHFPQLSPTHLVGVLEASVQAGVEVPEGVMAAHQAVTQQLGESLTVQQRRRLAGAYRKLREGA